MDEAGYVVCATCGDYAVDFNAVMLDCSTCENSYHHTCVGMGLGELGRRTAATNAMRKSKGKGKGDGDVRGTLYDWICPDCHQQQHPRQPDREKEEVLVIEDTDDEDEDDGERTTYIDLSYNVDIHRVAPSQRALLPTTKTARRPAVHMQNVAGLLNRTNVGASTSTSRASNSNSNIGASTSASKPVPASTSASTSASPTSYNATMGATTTRNVQTPLSPPPSRSPSRTGPIAPVPFVDFTAMATSSKKRRRSLEAGEGGLEDERAKKKSRVAGPGPAALLRTPVEPIDLTLSDDDIGVAPAAPSTSSRHAAASVPSRRDAASASSRRDAASVSSAGSRSRHGPGSVSSGTTDIATEDEPVPTRNLMRASLAGRTPRVPLPLAVGARGTAASSSTTRPAASSSTTRPAASPTASSKSTVPSKRRLSASPSNSHLATVKRAVVQNPAEHDGRVGEQEDDDDEEHAFFRSRRTAGGGSGGGGLTRTRSDAAVLTLPASTSSATPRSAVPTRTQSDGALAPAPGSGSQPSRNASTSGSRAPNPLEKTSSSEADETPARRPTPPAAPRSAVPKRTWLDDALPPAGGTVNRKTTTANDGLPVHVSDEEQAASARRPVPASATSTSTSTTTTRTQPSSSRPLASEPRAALAVVDTPLPKKKIVAVHGVDVDDLPDYISDEEHEPEPESTALPAASTTSTAPSASKRPAAPVPVVALSSSRAPPTISSTARPTPTPTATTTASSATATVAGTTAFRKPALPPPRAAAPVSSNDGLPAPPTTTSQSQPLFLPDSPSPSPERRESQSQRERLMSLPPISFLDEVEVEEIDRALTEEDELEDEDEDGPFGSGAIRKKKTGLALKTQTKTKENGKEPARPAPATDEPRKEKLTHRHEEEQKDRSYVQQQLDVTGLSALLDRESGSVKKKKKHRERDFEPRPPAPEKTERTVPGAGVSAGVDEGAGESSTTGSVKGERKKRQRDRDRDAVDVLARPPRGLSASLEKPKHADAGEGELSTSGSAKEKKKKHRDQVRDRDAVDPLARPALDPSASLERTKNKHGHVDTDIGAGESSTSSSVKEKRKKHRAGDAGVLDALAVPSLGLSASASLEKKNKHRHLDTDVGEGESSTASSVKVKKKKHGDGDTGPGRSSTQRACAGEQIDLLTRPMIGLPGSTRHTVLGADAEAGESSTSSSVKKKKHRERERDAAEGVVDASAVPSQKTPTFKEPATPDRRVGDLTVSWGRLQELASFSPSSATKKTPVQVDVDGDGDGVSVPSTVREEASSSRQLGRKTARPPLSLDDSPPLPDKRSAVSSTGRPLAAVSAESVPAARFHAAGSTVSTVSPPAAAAGPSSAAPASSSSSAARPSASTSRPDAEQRKEKQPMQTQRARKTVSRREDRDAAPAQVSASSSSAAPERLKIAAALERAAAPGKGKSTLDKYSARAVASSSSTVLPPSASTSTLPPSSHPSAAAVLGPSSSRPSAPSTAPSSSRSKHKHRERPPVADPSLPFEAPVVPRRKAIAGVDYPLPDLPVSPTKAKPDKKATARKVPRHALVSDEETPMDVDVDVDARVRTGRKGKEKEQAIINVVDDFPPKEKARPESRPKPPPIPRLRSASIWSSSTPTPAPSPYTTSSPSLDAVTAFLKKRRMANPLPSSSTLPSAPTQGQKMAATKRRLERGEHESDLPVPMSVLANAREMQTLRRLVKRSIVVEKPEYRVGEVKSDVVMAFDWAKYRERKEKETDEQGVGDFDTT